jgi:hypothetical protein
VISYGWQKEATCKRAFLEIQANWGSHLPEKVRFFQCKIREATKKFKIQQRPLLNP